MMSESEGKNKLEESDKIGEHGPGPPPTRRGEHPGTSNMDQQQPSSRSYAGTDDRLGRELERKEEEIRRLRGEVQSYIMKIRGYQTLEHLLQESKQECTRYKQKHDDVASKLDSLNRRLVIGRRNTSAAAENMDAAGSGGSSTADARKKTTAEEEEEEMELRSGAGSPMKSAAAAAAAGSSSAASSSPSFVRINSSGSAAASPLVSFNFGDTSKQPAVSAGSGVPMSHSASLEVQQLTDIVQSLRVGGGGGPADCGAPAAASLVQDLSSNLIRTGISVRNLEKQNRIQKVMVDQMSATINDLTRQNRDKDRTIADLQQQCEKLQSVVRGVELAREAAISEARRKYTGGGGTTEELSAASQQDAGSSGEWMQVEKRVVQAAAAATGKEEEEVEVTAVSTAELELRKRVDKLNASIYELVTVNRSWDEHCKKLALEHGQQVSALTGDLAAARRQLDDLREVERRFQELKQVDERKLIDFDQMLLSAKKQREIEEMAKEEALNQLHQEKRYRAGAEQRCAELDRRVEELNCRVHELQASKQGSIVGASVTGATNLSAGDRDLELQVLREQVTVFKEDFDHERRDREAAREATERLQATLNAKTAQLEDTQTKLFRALEDLMQAQNDNSLFRSRFERVAEEIKVLQHHARSSPTLSTTVAPPPRAAGNYVTAPTSVWYPAAPSGPSPSSGPPPAAGGNHGTHRNHSNHRQAARGLDEVDAWPCPKCTFLNADANMVCEMCGLLRRELLLQLRQSNATTYDAAGGTVAGLPIRRPVLHNSSPAWPPLPNGSLETDQP